VTPDVQYVKTSDGVHIAYQVFGHGAFDLVCVPGFAYNVEHAWRLEPVARAYRRLAGFSRVIVFDRRGTGLSDRIDRSDPQTLDARMDDIRAVMDAAGVERGVLFGYEDGANLCAVFAASNPSRVLAAVLHGSAPRGLWAPDYPWAWRADQWTEYLERIDAEWGTQEFADFMIDWAWPSQAGDATFRREWASFLRQSASPAAALAFERLARDTDIRDVLGTIQVPVLVTHRVGDMVESIEIARDLAAQIPGARLVELPGTDHHLLAGDVASLLDAVERFLVSVKDEEVDVDRVLATVLFTDLVGSTETAARIGDRAWRDLVTAHDQRVRTLLGRYRGREVDRAGDGFFAVFDGPARAVRCALAIGDALEPLGMTVRAGLHTGEIELDGADVRGIAVNIGARVSAAAAAREVLVSSTVKDLVAGSGLGFETRGRHVLKGIPDEWELFAAVPRVTEPLV
jgi:pimeloyl-ACP methyl ester carboxylesterase